MKKNRSMKTISGNDAVDIPGAGFFPSFLNFDIIILRLVAPDLFL